MCHFIRKWKGEIINKEIALRDKKEAIVDDRKSNASGRPASTSGLRKPALDTLSVASSR